MSHDDAYLERAQQALDRAKEKRKHYRGSCSKCKYVRFNMVGDICTHPAVQLVAFNLTDAYDKSRIQQCSEQRDRESVFGPVVCGPNGALFEEGKNSAQGFFARLFKI